jgi:hypothetical protein
MSLIFDIPAVATPTLVSLVTAIPVLYGVILAVVGDREATVEREPEFAELLTEITASKVFSADELPKPTEEQRKPPKIEVDTGQARLH